MKYIFLFLFLACFAGYVVAAEPAYSSDENNDGHIDRWVSFEDDIMIVENDTNFDGAVDFLAKYSEEGYKLYEEFDFNADGSMDDFYYYSNNVLRRQEIDTNFDQKIDVWVYLFKGVYIQKYERDLDFDGTIDLIKDFDEE